MSNTFKKFEVATLSSADIEFFSGLGIKVSYVDVSQWVSTTWLNYFDPTVPMQGGLVN